jgi:hypothetical protein
MPDFNQVTVDSTTTTRTIPAWMDGPSVATVRAGVPANTVSACFNEAHIVAGMGCPLETLVVIMQIKMAVPAVTAAEQSRIGIPALELGVEPRCRQREAPSPFRLGDYPAA